MELGDTKTDKYIRTLIESLPESDKIELDIILSAVEEHSRLAHLLERNHYAQLDSKYDCALFRELNKLSGLPMPEYCKQLRLALIRMIEDMRKECVERGLINASEAERQTSDFVKYMHSTM